MVVQDIRAIWAPGQLSPKALAATLYKSKGDKGGHVCASPDKHPSITATLFVYRQRYSFFKRIPCPCYPMAGAPLCENQMLNMPANNKLDCAGQNHWIL